MIAIRCRRCDTVIESPRHHDYVSCLCGAVAVDGGTVDLQRTGSPEDWEELAVVAPREPR